jgi:hypothetical protein
VFEKAFWLKHLQGFIGLRELFQDKEALIESSTTRPS